MLKFENVEFKNNVCYKISLNKDYFIYNGIIFYITFDEFGSFEVEYLYDKKNLIPEKYEKVIALDNKLLNLSGEGNHVLFPIFDGMDINNDNQVDSLIKHIKQWNEMSKSSKSDVIYKLAFFHANKYNGFEHLEYSWNVFCHMGVIYETKWHKFFNLLCIRRVFDKGDVFLYQDGEWKMFD